MSTTSPPPSCAGATTTRSTRGARSRRAARRSSPSSLSGRSAARIARCPRGPRPWRSAPGCRLACAAPAAVVAASPMTSTRSGSRRAHRRRSAPRRGSGPARRSGSPTAAADASRPCTTNACTPSIARAKIAATATSAGRLVERRLVQHELVAVVEPGRLREQHEERHVGDDPPVNPASEKGSTDDHAQADQHGQQSAPTSASRPTVSRRRARGESSRAARPAARRRRARRSVRSVRLISCIRLHCLPACAGVRQLLSGWFSGSVSRRRSCGSPRTSRARLRVRPQDRHRREHVPLGSGSAPRSGRTRPKPDLAVVLRRPREPVRLGDAQLAPDLIASRL